MKGRLLMGLLAIATIVLWMYYKLTILNPGLVSGFIVLATGIISHVINSAEDILTALFQVGEVPKPKPTVPPVKPLPVAPGSPTAAPIIPVALICLGLIFASGCASAGLNSVCLNIQGSGISTPYTGSGKLNANGAMCAMGGVSAKGLPPTYEELKDLTIAFINKQDSNKMIVPGAGTLTFTPTDTK